MPDYKEMYFDLFRAMGKAADILIEAQQRCEEQYISAEEPEMRVLPIDVPTDAFVESSD